MTGFEPGDFSPYNKIFPELSDAQARVVSLYSHGVSCESIAFSCDITVNTVNTHLKNAMHKYNKHSYSELSALFHLRVTTYLMKSFVATPAPVPAPAHSHAHSL